MAIVILKEFLRLGLMQGIDDPEFVRLTKAAERVRQRLGGTPTAVRRYSVALLDQNLPDDDPTLGEIEGDIEEEWVTFRGKFSNQRPVALLRAVGFQGLAAFVESTESTVGTHLAWLSASTPLERTPLGAEGDLLRRLFQKWGEASEREAEKDWENAEEFSLPANPSLDKIAVQKTETEAFGVPAGGTLTPEATAPVIDQVVANLVAGATQNIVALKKALTGALNAGLVKLAESQKRRLSLLWWKQTLYSPSRRTGYRTISSPAGRVVAIVSDLREVLPSIYPQSVEYLLREVVAEVVTEPDSWGVGVAGFTKALLADRDALATLQKAGGSDASVTDRGRVPLLSFLIAVARGTASVGEASLRVGVPEAEPVGAADMAVWLLREFTADALTIPDKKGR